MAAAEPLPPFDALYRELSGPVSGLVQRILGNHAHAEEVVQEVFLEVWRLAVRFDGRRGDLRSWVMTIAHRRAVDRVRAVRAAATREARLGRLTDPASPADGILDQVARRLECARVHDCLRALPAAQREVIHLVYYAHRTQREIAELLDVPLSTVRGRVRSGLLRLRACLERR